MIVNEYRRQAMDWAKSQSWPTLLWEAVLLVLFILTSTRLLPR